MGSASTKIKAQQTSANGYRFTITGSPTTTASTKVREWRGEKAINKQNKSRLFTELQAGNFQTRSLTVRVDYLW